MIFTKTNPVSEDAWINRLLTQMESELLTLWGVTTNEVAFYGRVDKGAEGKVFWVKNGKNIDPLTNDKLKFVSYVAVDQLFTFINNRHYVNAKLVCQGNLSTLYPTITAHRPDAELRKQIQQLLFKRLDNPTNYLGMSILDQSELKNSHPFHTFELNFVIIY